MSERFNLENYVTVAQRITEFWNRFPEGRIETTVSHIDSDNVPNRMIIVHASVFHSRDAYSPIATGIAKEREGTGMANKTSFAENAETSAIGRALANLGLLTEKERPSREEMEAVERGMQAHAEALVTIKTLGMLLPEDSYVKQKIRTRWADLKEDYALTFKLLHEVQEEVPKIPKTE